MSSNKSLFLAKGQVRTSEASQDILDAWNRNAGYRNCGVPQRDDWQKAEIANKTLMRSDENGGMLYVMYDGQKYVFKPDVELVDG